MMNRFVISTLLFLLLCMPACRKESETQQPFDFTGRSFEGTIEAGRGGENRIIIDFLPGGRFRITQIFTDPESGDTYPFYDYGTWARIDDHSTITFTSESRFGEADLATDWSVLSGFWSDHAFSASIR